MENDLISRQAAIDAINNAFDRETLLTGFVRSVAVRAISDLQSAQPEIIRCKDCKHHGTNGYRLYRAVFCCTMPDDGFCSCGERREDG